MDEKATEELQPKITRSRARHLRRKRLIIARKAAEKTSDVVEIKKKIEDTDVDNQIRDETEDLTKSKARRLKKKSKKETCQSPTSLDNSEIHSTNSTSCSLSEESRVDVDRSRQELLENEKNLEINKTTAFESFNNELESNKHQLTSDLIINNVSTINETFDSIAVSNKSKDCISNEITLGHAVSNANKAIPLHPLNRHEIKMNAEDKTREQIKAEREAKKAVKAAAKNKSKNVNQQVQKPEEVAIKPNSNSPIVENVTPSCCPHLGEKISEVKLDVKPLTNKLSKLSVAEEQIAPSSSKGEGKSKAELRAERRAKQEAQRAAKHDQLDKAKPKAEVRKPVQKAPQSPQKSEELAKKVVTKIVHVKNSHEICLFKHLYHEREQAFLQFPAVNSSIHPAIVRLGVQYASKVIVGSNARCIALLAAVKQLIEDFERPSQADFTRGLESSLQESSSYLNHCRPLAVSMQNALRHLKWQMTQLPSTISDEDAKTKLRCAIDTYIQEQILLADKAISITIQTKISNGDVILTYGYSSLIQKILCDAHDAGRQFRVVVVDGRPLLEGKELLRRLAKHGVECSYVLINALSFIMPEVSKVFLGAHAILANGAVMSRAGTAQIALMAKAFNVPVLVACETHKSSERVQTDSIVYNEIGDADELTQNVIGSTKKSALVNWKAKKSLNLLNITYDVTPADLVTAVVTELAILPCTSVPVILRIKPSEI